jgi:hypothetical protein
MEQGQSFSEVHLARLRAVCRAEPRLAAMYAFDLEQRGDCNLAALFVDGPSWPERLDLELAVGKALGREGIELMSLRRLPLVVRYNVVQRGEPIYVGRPDKLVVFVEETIARYSAFYPLLEALYWKVETRSLAEDMLEL